MSLPLRTSTAALLVLSLLTLGACDQQPVSPDAAPALNGLPQSPPGREDAGFVTFTYSGDESGRFFALGAPTGFDGTAPTGERFAAGRHYVLGSPPFEHLGTTVTASDRSGGGLLDQLHLQFPGPLQTGTYTLNSCGRGMPFCPVVNLVFDVDPSVDGGGAQARYYSLTSGTITVESVENGRVTGTFSGTAVQYYPNEGAGSEIVITDGRFDVPVTEVDLTQQG
ncbi:MAG TPA: hypothetical protein VGX50_01190 [Longimicrobium sp.]|jgi:hypothetical protein|nr:hypothetical protein [Longimicrobium sp.]